MSASSSGAAAGCTCALRGGGHPDLVDLLTFSRGAGTRTATWKSAHLQRSDPANTDIAACIVASSAVDWRCVGARALFERWSDAINARAKLDPGDVLAFEAHIEHVFGTPSKARDAVHRRGWLAEFVFYMLAEKIGEAPGRSLLAVDGPDWHATKPGPDSLVLWRQSTGEVEFRLWELKHTVGGTPVSTAVTDATSQLKTNAMKYLAQLTSIAARGSRHLPNDVRAVYGDLVELWSSGSDASGIGISVTTDDVSVPTRCFSRVAKSFPALTSMSQVEGAVVGIADFAAFANTVRDRVWMPL